MPLEVNAASGRLYWLGWRPIWIADHAAASQAPEVEAMKSPTIHHRYLCARGDGCRSVGFGCDQLLQLADPAFSMPQVAAAFDQVHQRFGGMSMAQFNSSRSKAPAAPTSASDVRGC